MADKAPGPVDLEEADYRFKCARVALAANLGQDEQERETDLATVEASLRDVPAMARELRQARAELAALRARDEVVQRFLVAGQQFASVAEVAAGVDDQMASIARVHAAVREDLAAQLNAVPSCPTCRDRGVVAVQSDPEDAEPCPANCAAAQGDSTETTENPF